MLHAAGGREAARRSNLVVLLVKDAAVPGYGILGAELLDQARTAVDVVKTDLSWWRKTLERNNLLVSNPPISLSIALSDYGWRLTSFNEPESSSQAVAARGLGVLVPAAMVTLGVGWTVVLLNTPLSVPWRQAMSLFES